MRGYAEKKWHEEVVVIERIKCIRENVKESKQSEKCVEEQLRGKKNLGKFGVEKKFLCNKGLCV